MRASQMMGGKPTRGVMPFQIANQQTLQFPPGVATAREPQATKLGAVDSNPRCPAACPSGQSPVEAPTGSPECSSMGRERRIAAKRGTSAAAMRKRPSSWAIELPAGRVSRWLPGGEGRACGLLNHRTPSLRFQWGSLLRRDEDLIAMLSVTGLRWADKLGVCHLIPGH